MTNDLFLIHHYRAIKCCLRDVRNCCVYIKLFIWSFSVVFVEDELCSITLDLHTLGSLHPSTASVESVSSGEPVACAAHTPCFFPLSLSCEHSMKTRILSYHFK